MKISLSNAGKRFNREWIFRNASLEFTTGNKYAITGPNGSGKSTFLQVIGGMLQLSEGKIRYDDDKEVAPEDFFNYTSFCAPYLEVIEEMTLLEFLRFHNQFKNFIEGHDAVSITTILGLEAAANKQIRYYSSGMKQRVKLAQAIFTASRVILLDEPTTNLDFKGAALYRQLIDTYSNERIIIICSNDESEYTFCNEFISITDYK